MLVEPRALVRRPTPTNTPQQEAHVGRAAHSPALLGHLLAGFGAFERSSLSVLEREVIALTVAFENDCHYCMAMRSAILAANAEAAPMVSALRAGTTVPDLRLEAGMLFRKR